MPNGEDKINILYSHEMRLFYEKESILIYQFD